MLLDTTTEGLLTSADYFKTLQERARLSQAESTFNTMPSPDQSSSFAVATTSALSPITTDTGAAESSDRDRVRVELNGEWTRYVNGAPYDRIRVPSSRRPLGYYRLRRIFLLPRLAGHQRAVVHFDAITYHGRVFINGIELGTMGPYVPYEFDFTPHAKEGTNQIEVAIADLVPDPTGAGKDEIELGVGGGWEAYGGIIRDAYVELRNLSSIENVRFGYSLNQDYTLAACRIQVFMSCSAESSGQLEVGLYQGKGEVAKGTKIVTLAQGMNEVEVRFDVKTPLLWSPQEPSLYELRTCLKTDGGSDRFTCRTGFRDIVIRGSVFELNGKHLVLNGVCRHDMWKDQGFTLSREQMEQDMRMIKGLGCNFARLVHYPNHRYVVDLAEQLGLLVSEEPGYWNHDFKTMSRSLVELGLRTMEKTIRRDWNSPAVFAWLLGNECNLTVEYLKEGKALCNRLDPIGRPVSFANSMGNQETKRIFEEAGMDFFDQHTYGFDENKFEKTADVFGNSRPTTLTEWGWEDAGRGQIVYDRNFGRLLDMVEAKKIAGHMFWSWQDMRQYSRIDWPTQNGILMSGVVTESREPRPRLYMELARLFQLRRDEVLPASARPLVLPLRRTPWSAKSGFKSVDLQPLADSTAGQNAWSDLESLQADFWSKSRMARDQWKRTGEHLLFWKNPEVQIAGTTFLSPIRSESVRPLVLTAKFNEIEIPLNLTARQVHILGQVTLPSGYPVIGQIGQTVGSYQLRYSGGKVQDVALREGIEVARANLIHGATRISPLVTSSQRVLEFVKDVAREHYQILLFSVPTAGNKLDSITCRLTGDQPLLIFAVTAELP